MPGERNRKKFSLEKARKISNRYRAQGLVTKKCLLYSRGRPVYTMGKSCGGQPLRSRTQKYIRREMQEECRMKIAVICANGRAGRRIVQEALSRGIDVTAVVRESNQTEAKQVLKKDLFDLRRLDGGHSPAAQYVFEASLRRSQRYGDPPSGCRRRGQPVCQPRAHRLPGGQSGFPRRVQAVGCCYGKGARRASPQRGRQVDIRQPCGRFPR